MAVQPTMQELIDSTCFLGKGKVVGMGGIPVKLFKIALYSDKKKTSRHPRPHLEGRRGSELVGRCQ